jgi:excisionase family DNA binding protein
MADSTTTWMPDAPLLLSFEQTAAWLNLSTRTIRRLVARRELVGRRIGGRVLIPRKSIEAFTRKDHQTLSDEEREKLKLNKISQ